MHRRSAPSEAAASEAAASKAAASSLESLLQAPAGEVPARVASAPRVEAMRWPEALRARAGALCLTDAAAARAVAQRALQVAQILDDPVSLGWGHRAMAEAWMYSGRMQAAEASYAQAASVCRASGNDALLGQLLVGRIHVLTLLGREKEADEAVREARRCLERAGDRLYLAKLAMNLGNRYFQADRYAPALAEYDRAAALFRALRTRDHMVVVLEMNRGVALTNLDLDEEALAVFTRLERECLRSGYDLLLGQVRMNAAYLHLQRGDFDLALRALGSASGYFQETEHPAFSATCLLNRAEIYQQLNLHQEAYELAARAGPLFASEGLRYDEALALAENAIAALALGEARQAARGIRRARTLFTKLGNTSRAAVMELLLAETLSRGRGRRDAATRARSALGTFRALGLTRWEAAAAVLLERLDPGRGGPAERIERLRGLVRRIPGRLYPIPACGVLEALGRAQERAGKPRAAAASYRKAVERLEAVRFRIPTEDSKIAFLQDKTHLYDRLLALEMRRARPSVARLFDWSERARAQSLLDQIRDPASGPWLLPERGDRAARRRLSWLHARISRLELGSPEERAQAAALLRRLKDAERDWSRALREEDERTPSHRDPEGPAPTPEAGLEQIACALPVGWGFLSFHAAEDCSFVIAVTREGARWRPLAADLRARAQDLAERLELQWSTAAITRLHDAGPLPVRPAERILREAHALLWAPLREIGVLPAGRWLVATHGPLQRIPLHALLGPEGYVAESCDLAVVPSARVWLAMPRTRRPHGAYVAGVPSPELPAIEAEVDSVCRILAALGPVRDLAPTGEAFRREARRAGLIHLAAHGVLRRDNPAYSSIRLADGPLFMHDLRGLRIPGSLVVLTACSAGHGALPAGHEWIGLARGFLEAGASSVVASLWPIEDGPTRELVELFYGAWAEGRSAPEALGAAMRGLLRSRPHPWNWASFAALGGIPARRHGPGA